LETNWIGTRGYYTKNGRKLLLEETPIKRLIPHTGGRKRTIPNRILESRLCKIELPD